MSAQMTKTELGAAVASARESLAETLDSLDEQDWDRSSLCAEWAVRDVVGHLLHQYEIYRSPHPRLSLLRAGMRVNRFLADEAIRRARGRPGAQLLADLRSAEYERTLFWRAYPGRHFALSEYVIHAQDIRRPLGRPEKPALAHLQYIADIFAKPARLNPFRPTLPPTRFEATDADWTSGQGLIARGPLEAIVMVLAGRGHALSDLEGDGVGALANALA